MMASNVINGQIILEEEYDETYEPTEDGELSAHVFFICLNEYKLYFP